MIAADPQKPLADITSDMPNMEQAARIIAQGLMVLNDDDGIDRFVKIHVFKNGHLLVWAELSKRTNPVLRDAIATINPQDKTVSDLHRFSRSNDNLPWLAELRFEELLHQGRAE